MEDALVEGPDSLVAVDSEGLNPELSASPCSFPFTYNLLLQILMSDFGTFF